MKRILNV